ncbi:hypothetical protein E2C01_086285 [Portunus trituberculatus]|uniref:Uncharacterized protein n=1 Tax=Portunus trituberculatus TaxID=210409 RepID=A0A5B7J0C9_PORTR|nr:hypothetical protein [Portunus trituberculatus]
MINLRSHLPALQGNPSPETHQPTAASSACSFPSKTIPIPSLPVTSVHFVSSDPFIPRLLLFRGISIYQLLVPAQTRLGGGSAKDRHTGGGC